MGYNQKKTKLVCSTQNTQLWFIEFLLECSRKLLFWLNPLKPFSEIPDEHELQAQPVRPLAVAVVGPIISIIIIIAISIIIVTVIIMMTLLSLFISSLLDQSGSAPFSGAWWSRKASRVLGRLYLSNAACLTRPRSFYASFVVSRITINCQIIRHFWRNHMCSTSSVRQVVPPELWQPQQPVPFTTFWITVANSLELPWIGPSQETLIRHRLNGYLA